VRRLGVSANEPEIGSLLLGGHGIKSAGIRAEADALVDLVASEVPLLTGHWAARSLPLRHLAGSERD
jgi:hypothetical protein